jgi:hypothetical protein
MIWLRLETMPRLAPSLMFLPKLAPSLMLQLYETSLHEMSVFLALFQFAVTIENIMMV